MPELSRLQNCACCPRQCRVNRLAGELGYCRTGPGYQIGSICIHRGEEPAITGTRGICNVFFTHCNLQCKYCQNHQISNNESPEIEYTLGLAEAAGRVETYLRRGIRAVGFVSPSHVVPQIRALIGEIRQRGHRPVTVYNTNAYDRVETLRTLETDMDVYLPDFKYGDDALATRYSDAPDYPRIALAALQEMVRQKGTNLVLDENNEIRSGVIVRHLVLPGNVENSRQVLRLLAGEISPEITVSLMAQYNPLPGLAADSNLGRGVTQAEYDAVLEEMDRLGMEQGWIQELESRECYQPDFAQTHPFESS
jgi:putative pyruvate formate lyase activating enzyme